MVNKQNEINDLIDYHDQIVLFADWYDLDYNPSEMMVTVERRGKVIYKELTEVAVDKSKYDNTSVFKAVEIFFSDNSRQELQLYIGQDPHYNKFEFDFANKSLKITTRDNTIIYISKK